MKKVVARVHGRRRGATLLRKKANMTCGGVLHIRNEKLHGHFYNPNTTSKKIFLAKFRTKYAYMNNFKGPVYFYERKFKAPQKV